MLEVSVPLAVSAAAVFLVLARTVVLRPVRGKRHTWTKRQGA